MKSSGRPAIRSRVAVPAVLVVVAVLAVAVFLFAPKEREAAQQGGSRAKPQPMAGTSSLTQTQVESAAAIEAADVIVADEAAAQAERQLEASRTVPVHNWHMLRLENIANETVEQTAENLGHLDDNHLADASISAYSPACTEWHICIVTRLVRVRKLLEMGRADGSKVIPVLERLLADAVDSYQAALEQSRAEAEAGRLVGWTVYDEPPRIVQLKGRALGGVYILAELADYDALPLFARCYRLHDYPVKRSPVHQAVTLYGMHRLVSSFPEKGLSLEARGLREEYLEASKILASPEEKMVTAWSAEYTESDPRIMIFDPEGRVLKGQPKMEMAIWPARFSDNGEIGNYIRISERGQMLFEKLEAFIGAAFPGEDKPN